VLALLVLFDAGFTALAVKAQQAGKSGVACMDDQGTICACPETELAIIAPRQCRDGVLRIGIGQAGTEAPTPARAAEECLDALKDAVRLAREAWAPRPPHPCAKPDKDGMVSCVTTAWTSSGPECWTSCPNLREPLIENISPGCADCLGKVARIREAEKRERIAREEKARKALERADEVCGTEEEKS
jgi:hypothetical protein